MRRYIPKRHSSIETSSKNISISVIKGGSDALRVDYKEIERIIASLRRHCDDRLDLLDAATKKDIEKLDKTIVLQYNTDSYPDLYALVQKYFSDVEHIIPNTVGSYCYGCQQVKGFADIGCAATCVNGIPPPKLPDWAKCDHTVILLTRKEGHNYSKVLNATHNKSHAYVFIMDLTKDGNTSPKLNAEEHLVISRLGIKKCHIFEYKHGKYYDISKGIINMADTFTNNDIELYAGNSNKYKRHIKSNPIVGGVFVVFIIILILVILGLVWRKQRTHRY